jgi:cytochrome b
VTSPIQGLRYRCWRLREIKAHAARIHDSAHRADLVCAVSEPMIDSLANNTVQRNVQVWDGPTRLFHWLLLALVVIAWLTGEGEGGTGDIHRYAGEAIAGLIVFRVIWGFFGGEHARFSDFAAGPTVILAHVRNLFTGKPTRHLGHNPLGGLAVFLLLATVAVIVVTGLFSGGEENAGPFAGLWGLELSDVHDVAFRVLQGLVIVHLIGVAVETFKAKDALVPAMITGLKQRRPDEPGANARRAGFLTLIVALGLGAATTAALVSMPPSTLVPSERGGEAEDSD